MTISDISRKLNSRNPAPDAPTAPEGPIEVYDSEALDGVLARQKFDLETLQPDAESLQTLRDFTTQWSDRIWDRPIFSLAWPAGLYIPGEADWRKYWISEPPHENVYQHDWTGSTHPVGGGASANNGTGEVTATISPWTLSGTSRSWASIGIEYSPSARLSQVRFSAEVIALGVKQLWFLTGAGYTRFDYFVSVFLSGWEINPVTNKWEKLPQFARHEVVKETHYGQQGGSATYPVALNDGDLGVNFLVERGKRYVFGVTFQATIIADVREHDERTPYRQRHGDTIALQARLGGSVPRMSVETTAVYQS